jgi:copper chaperone
MAARTVTVPNISCDHCARTIKRELGNIQGVTGVEVNTAGRKVTVRWQEPPLTWEDIRRALEGINYPPQESS